MIIVLLFNFMKGAKLNHVKKREVMVIDDWSDSDRKIRTKSIT
jgi:hypothetical protein